MSESCKSTRWSPSTKKHWFHAFYQPGLADLTPHWHQTCRKGFAKIAESYPLTDDSLLFCLCSCAFLHGSNEVIPFTDFTFRQVAAGRSAGIEDYYIDLVFYNMELKCCHGLQSASRWFCKFCYIGCRDCFKKAVDSHFWKFSTSCKTTLSLDNNIIGCKPLCQNCFNCPCGRRLKSWLQILDYQNGRFSTDTLSVPKT